MKKIREARSAERGAVLVITLLVTVAMLIVIMPFLSKLSGQYRSTDRSFKSFAALNLAEAGVEMAIWELNDGTISSWDGSDVERTLTLSSVQSSGGDVVGDVVITVSNLEGSTPVILSTGKVPFRNDDTVDRTLRVIVTKDHEILFASALFGSDGLLFAGNSYVDGYDSREGDYGKKNKDLDVSIGTNATHIGAITLDDKAKVVGSALIGYEGDPDDILILNKAKVTGETSAMTQIKELPPIIPPQGLPYRGEISADKGKFTITESGEYSSIFLGKKAEIKIKEDVTLYITGEFNMINGAKFTVDEGVRVQIYLGTSFYMANGAQFNKKLEDPTMLQIWGTESFVGDFIWECENQFCGAVYLPHGNVILDGNMEYYGSIQAKTIHIDANTKLHYDIALQEIDTPYFKPFYTVTSWHEKLLPSP